MSDDKETPIYHPNSPDGDDGCSRQFAGIILVGLVVFGCIFVMTGGECVTASLALTPVAIKLLQGGL